MGPLLWAQYLLRRAWVRAQLDPVSWFWYGVLIMSLIGLAVTLPLIAAEGH
jgi:hypothetical protein